MKRNDKVTQDEQKDNNFLTGNSGISMRFRTEKPVKRISNGQIPLFSSSFIRLIVRSTLAIFNHKYNKPWKVN